MNGRLAKKIRRETEKMKKDVLRNLASEIMRMSALQRIAFAWRIIWKMF